MGVYDRNPALRRTHPLGGSGAVKQRRASQKRARLTPDEKEARTREREARAKEREEKRLKKAQVRADFIYMLPDPPRKPTPLEIRRDALAYDEASLKMTLVDLAPRGCRWPVNTPEPKDEYLFCGHQAKLGSTYCKHHAKRAVLPMRVQSIAKPRLADKLKS